MFYRLPKLNRSKTEYELEFYEWLINLEFKPSDKYPGVYNIDGGIEFISKKWVLTILATCEEYSN